MPKSKKRYKIKKKHEVPEAPQNTGFFANRPKRERTPEEKREYLKLFLFLVTWVVLLTGIYMVCLQLEFEPILPIYLGLGIILFFVWLIYNGGIKKPDIDKIEKPEETSYEDFCAFIDKLKERQRKAKYFLVLFIPFPMIMLVDFTIMAWGEKL